MGEWLHIFVTGVALATIYYCIRFVVRSIGKFIRGEQQ